MKIVNPLICSLLFMSPVSVAAQNDPLLHGYALLIGTSAYSDSRWPPLADVNLQVQQLKSALDPHFDEVQVLPNPTFHDLDRGLRDFLRLRGNGDTARLFVYYAGHGYTETDLSRNELRGYITGRDTPFPDGSAKGFSAARTKAVSMEAVRGMVSDVNARQVLIVFDSCFAGTVFTARSPSSPPPRLSDDEISHLSELPVREFITAGDYNQPTPAHSPIPQLLINGLEGAADPYKLGVVSGEQLAQYLWSETRDIGLTPREGKLPGGYFDRGEFFFRVLSGPGLRSDLCPLPSPEVEDFVCFLFRRNSSILDNDALYAISLIAKAANKYPRYKFDLHPVFYWDEFQNPDIGRRRIQGILDQLKADGVNEDRIPSNNVSGGILGASPKQYAPYVIISLGD
jgi:hypothetical protein